MDSATTTPVEPMTTQSTAIHNPEISPANNNRLVGYEYDLAGNVTKDAQNRTFGYDAENHQLAYNGGALITSGDSASYSYDGDGKRVKKQVGGSMASTVFVYNIAGQLVAEYTDSPESRTAQTSYVTTDTLGSTRVVTGQDQSVKERHDYLPFGEDIGAQGVRTEDQKFDTNALRQRFTGYEKDGESGLDFAQARYFAGVLGRFTSVDPLMASARPELPQSWNRYTYCINNPLVYIDPQGLDWYSNDGGDVIWFEKGKQPKGFSPYNPPDNKYISAGGTTVELNLNGPNPNADPSDHFAWAGWKATIYLSTSEVSSPDNGEVFLCSRPAELNVLGVNANPFGFVHQWIKTSTTEAGLGPEGGGVPGEGGSDSAPRVFVC